ncbi:MAG: RluA family pseudouridine synthase [Kiritimatiellia bacterium]
MKRPAPKPPSLRRLPPVRRNGTPLLDHLAECLSLSRRAAKNLLDDRMVFVNGRRIWMARHLLQNRDLVELLPDAASPQQAQDARVRILFDDPKFLVADKPPRLLTTGEKSLELRLRDQLGLPALRAVHRLDKDTSGCVLFAKDEETRLALVAQFEEGRVRKLYHALVAGHLPEPQMDVRLHVDHLPAVSHVRQVSAQARPPRCAHLTVAIETGRTHQIRIHLHHVGNPVLGDRQYFSARCADFPEVPRQMLHASELRFAHPATGKPVCASAPLPRDFRDWLRALRLA